MKCLLPLGGSLNRVLAMVVRYRYLMLASWPRLIELAYWPTVQMVLWGLINRFLVGQSEGIAQTAGMLIAAALLWDVLYRAQLGVSIVFFEEMYSRNLGNLFVSPLRPYELALSLLAVSFLRTLFGVGVASGLAILLYHYSIFDMGLPLVAFFCNLLVMGWAIGLMVVAMVLRYGLGMEGFAWAIIFAFAPLSGVYYPISVLPEWLQPFARALPSSHAFEGMRALLSEGVFRMDHFIAAVELNTVFLGAGLCLYALAFWVSRKKGLLLQMGE
ncbi:MAG: ABC transporter permease [Methylococcaceae bacterium]|jgi:ABC-2 type transport system permease protein